MCVLTFMSSYLYVFLLLCVLTFMFSSFYVLFMMIVICSVCPTCKKIKDFQIES